MLFFIVRISFFGALFILFINFIKKSSIINKRKFCIISLIIFIIILTISTLFPIENIFLTFKTPGSAYNYRYSGKVELILNGKQSSFIIGKKNNYDDGTMDIIPKIKNGWKLSYSYKVKMIKKTYFDGIVISIYKNEDYNDYYINIYDTNGGLSKINDNCNSKFVHIKETSYGGKNYYSYYAYIENFNKKYEVTIGEKTIKVK